MGKQKVTSAGANKILRKLQDDKEFLLDRERESCVYIKVEGYSEEKPEYNYKNARDRIREIDEKIARIKHAINVFNCTTKLPNFEDMTIDRALIKMAQLNKEKDRLDVMRKRLPQSRKQERYGTSSSLVEYICANYDIEAAKSDYDAICDEIIQLQMDIDFVNQTELFEL